MIDKNKSLGAKSSERLRDQYPQESLHGLTHFLSPKTSKTESDGTVNADGSVPPA